MHGIEGFTVKIHLFSSHSAQLPSSSISSLGLDVIETIISTVTHEWCSVEVT